VKGGILRQSQDKFPPDEPRGFGSDIFKQTPQIENNHNKNVDTHGQARGIPLVRSSPQGLTVERNPAPKTIHPLFTVFLL